MDGDTKGCLWLVAIIFLGPMALLVILLLGIAFAQALSR